MIGTIALTLALVLPGPVREHTRAMWVWKTSAILKDAHERSEFFKFLDAPKGYPKARISVLFFACDLVDASSHGALQSFVTDAHAHSVRVDYLCGDPTYATPAHMGTGVEQLNYVLRYNDRAPQAARFDGIQYDVEPYALPDWPAESNLANFITFLGMCRKCLDGSHQALALGVAIPRWYDGADLHGLYKSVLDRADYVAVMDYVSKPDQFVSAAINTVKYASKKHKDVWLGAEVSELPAEKTATFFALGNAKLEETFSAAERAFGTYKGFAGVAIEWYDTYITLKP
jgi:hypothetical protein